MIHLALNGNTVAFTLALLALSLILSIVGLRYYWKNKLSNAVSRSNNSPLKNTGGLHAFGICLALLMTITLMSWTKAERVVHNYTPDPTDYGDVIIIPPTVQLEKKKDPIPLPPPPNPIIEVVEDLDLIEEPVKIPIEVPIEAVVETGDDASNLPQPAPSAPRMDLPDEKIIDVIPVVTIAERMPRFPGCNSGDLSEAESKKCTDAELLDYVYANLNYPKIARENNIEGRVILQFVIDTKGDISDVKVVRDIGAVCGAAAAKVVVDMVEKKGFWTPGKQRHRLVKVRYTLPITFKLAE